MIKMQMRRRDPNFTDGKTESTDIATMIEKAKWYFFSLIKPYLWWWGYV